MYIPDWKMYCGHNTPMRMLTHLIELLKLLEWSSLVACTYYLIVDKL